MIILTAVITVGVGVQEWATWKMKTLSKKQADISEGMLKLQEQHLQDQQDARKPQLTISLAHGVDYEDGMRREYIGFSITNSGLVDTAINDWWFDVGVPESHEADSRLSKCNTREIKNRKALSAEFPQIIRTGQIVTVLFKREELIESLDNEFDGEQHRVRPLVIDGMGNYHHYCGWVQWSKGNTSTHHMPLQGYRPSEFHKNGRHFFPM